MESILEDKRFEYLLKPLRDMAENWEVDIALVLEQYLEILNEMEFAFDEGSREDGLPGDPGKKFSFAEAAYIIQGSGCVYSKKVEYLYNLASQALKFIISSKK